MGVRLGVLDVGSNTVHLVAVDATAGGRPTPMSDWKTSLRLVELVDDDGAIDERGLKKLTKAVSEAAELSQQLGCDEVIPFATSAVRSATNRKEVIEHVAKKTGITLEISTGSDEHPDVAYSLDLGAGRLTHAWFDTDPPERKKINLLRDYIDAELAEPAKMMRAFGEPRVAAATSKTFRTLARLTGAAPSSAGPFTKRTLTAPGLRQLIAFISRMTASDRAELEGVSADRSHQIVAGALVAEASMRALGLEELDICPWALREGVILQRIDKGLE